MLKFKFGAWAVVFMLAVLSFSACDDNDDETYNPPANIIEALKQLYPNAQNVEWEMKGNYYVADCWVTGDELDVWFDANANWVMTENELDSIDQLVPAVYTGFRNSNYSSWVVTDVFVLTYPQHSTESVIQVKQGNLHCTSHRKVDCCMKGISLTAMIRIGRLWDEMNLYRIDYQYEIIVTPSHEDSVTIIRLHLLIIFGQSSFARFFIK